MIGQSNLISKFKLYSLKTLPHSMLFVGEKGCGKHTLVKELERQFKISAIDISESLELETIQDINTCANSHFYIIDTSKINEKQQNVILKFLEEPTNSVYVILLATSKSTLLDTIVNRCMVFEFEPYSSQQLMQFLPFEEGIEILVEYCHTPGQVLSTTIEKIKILIELCDNIAKNVGKARFPNIFKISSRVMQEEIDLDLFYNVLLERLYRFFIDTQNVAYKDMYNITSNALKKHNDSRLNQELIIDSLVMELHEASRGKI